MKNMISKLSLTILLTFFSWTALLGQTGITKVSTWHTGETIICYDIEELRKLANMTTEAKEAIELYKIVEQQLALKDSIILSNELAFHSLDSILKSKDKIINLKEDIITGKDQEITALRNELTHVNRKLKWTNIKWASTSVIISGAALVLLLK